MYVITEKSAAIIMMLISLCSLGTLCSPQSRAPRGAHVTERTGRRARVGTYTLAPSAGTWPALICLLERRGKKPQHTFLDYSIPNYLVGEPLRLISLSRFSVTTAMLEGKMHAH